MERKTIGTAGKSMIHVDQSPQSNYTYLQIEGAYGDAVATVSLTDRQILELIQALAGAKLGD